MDKDNDAVEGRIVTDIHAVAHVMANDSHTICGEVVWEDTSMKTSACWKCFQETMDSVDDKAIIDLRDIKEHYEQDRESDQGSKRVC